MFKNNTLVVLTAASLLGLTACGGGGGGSAAPVKKDGIFKDSNVSGLSYISGDQTGVTDSSGSFTYEEGEDVAFALGGVKLGAGKGKAVMTPVDLVADGSLASVEVINKVRFLMMLDKDNTPSNGIEISQKVQDKAKSWETIDFAATDFPTQAVNRIVTEASVEDAVVHELPDALVATTHLKTTLLCANAGAYIGTYKGTESGNIALVVNPATGEVNGSSYNPGNEVSVDINSTTALDYDMGLEFVSAEDSAKVFTGKLDSTEAISGAWENSADTAQKGTFSAERLGGESDAVYRYTVSFTGGDKGLFTFDVDGDDVKGIAYSVSSNKKSVITGKLEDNELTAQSDDGTKIDGKLDEETLTLSGVWSNVTALEAGSYTGAGCRLN